MNRTSPGPRQQPVYDPPFKENETLPSSLSGLLEIAIGDAEELDRFHYIPYSENWHKTRYSDICEVCLAGCVIAGTLRHSHRSTLVPNMFSTETANKLVVIDDMRTGHWRSAFMLLYNQEPTVPISIKLGQIPNPFNPHFRGWDDFLDHLESLKKLLPQLEEIDALASESGFNSFDHDD